MFVCVFVSACVRACACVCLYTQAVLAAHDTVAQKSFDPVLPLLPEELEEELEEESVKIVRLVKNKEPLVRGHAPLAQLQCDTEPTHLNESLSCLCREALQKIHKMETQRCVCVVCV